MGNEKYRIAREFGSNKSLHHGLRVYIDFGVGLVHDEDAARHVAGPCSDLLAEHSSHKAEHLLMAVAERLCSELRVDTVLKKYRELCLSKRFDALFVCCFVEQVDVLFDGVTRRQEAWLLWYHDQALSERLSVYLVDGQAIYLNFMARRFRVK